MPKPDISVVVPVFNEEGNLPMLHERLGAVLAALVPHYELLFVNDGSRDGSLAILQALAERDPAHVRYVDFSRNFGHQIAVSAGLDHARGEAVVIIDADLQDPPEVIAELYRKMQEGYEVVYAQRRRREGESWLKRWTARYFYRILQRITSVDIPVDTGDFRIMRRCVVEVLRQMPEPNKFLRGQIAWVGYRQTHILYDRHERHAGSTGYTYRKMLRFALDGITAFSDMPLKIVTVLGFAVFGIALLAMLYVLYSRFVLRDYVQGWTSMMLIVLFIGSIQMIAIGIIGEYMSRINHSTRRRPLYVVRESNAQPQAPDGSSPAPH